MSPLLVVVTLGSALIYSVVAAADAAMSELSPSRLAALHEQSEGNAREQLGRFLQEPARIHGRWLAARVWFGVMVAVGVQRILEQLGKEPPFWQAVGAGVLLLLLLSEITTGLARVRARVAGPALLFLLRPIEWLMAPLADPLSWIGRGVARAVTGGGAVEEEPRLAEVEVGRMVEDAAKTGQIEPEPAEMIRNILDLKDLIVRDVMVPRIKIVAIEVDTPLNEVVEIVAREEHSRYPVYAQVIDNVVGLLYAKDLLTLSARGVLGDRTLREVMRGPVNFVPDTQPVATVLRDMRSRRQHMAVLVDEFGGVSGLVTLEDLLERIVGDIRDEYDPEEAFIQDLGGGRLLVDASVSLADLSAYLGIEIANGGDYGSLGGLLMHEAGCVPSVGDSIVASGLECIVRDGDAKRLLKVEVVRPPLSTATPSQPIPVP
ncbi:MAG: hemolysin family protein [Myxococcales bacterium]|nr:hemolysin family protein [Polyangiaceae bacterium]MDW8250381.1 hemolysin family protein [Myxococcales bacterium]